MDLDEYTICSCELDSIIDMVSIDAENEDFISVSVNKVGNSIFKIYVSAFSPCNLHYNKNIIGYALKDNKTILFYSITKDMLSKKADGRNRQTLWEGVRLLTQKLVAKRYMIA